MSDDPKATERGTLAWAVKVLNRYWHRGHVGWYLWGESAMAMVRGEDRYEVFGPFEAIAIAGAYEPGEVYAGLARSAADAGTRAMADATRARVEHERLTADLDAVIGLGVHRVDDRSAMAMAFDPETLKPLVVRCDTEEEARRIVLETARRKAGIPIEGEEKANV